MRRHRLGMALLWIGAAACAAFGWWQAFGRPLP